MYSLFGVFTPEVPSTRWDDNEIIRIFESNPCLPGTDNRLVQISDECVVKLGVSFESACSEMLAMDLVRSQATIPVPRVWRVIDHVHPDGTGLIVMDLIRNGRQLHVCWSSLSIWAKLKDVHSSTPGPLGPQPSRCKGLQFGLESKGPFPTTTRLAEHFHGELRQAENRYFRGQKPLDESIFAHLVLTHNDLNMRNILLDNEGRLWLVDWGWSGFFPAGFEYLAMRFAAQKDREPKGWQTSIKFMAEPSFEMERWLVGIGYDYVDI
ncbi:hypothetical protein PILCRDRAFT_98574 [Piloderma croceum F 1598]|uniref:Aminoglycoside phosphotransferase domain-containing protein n=1 Tax=Piloderma croceum (strain F 1598) TaxID=765440 RepID=A0A0C3AUF4_PILCF|nr:hypothetical protein PILCRDRAFT_98574 [Piloderma croceum F 1598]